MVLSLKISPLVTVLWANVVITATALGSYTKRFFRDNRGQDLVEYALIVAFAVGVVAVLTALYTTIKDVLTRANSALQSAAGQ
jgi:Flp pilus assembly pilin Flp